ncbi:hypothetical protein BJ165DRAFT_1403203 [Panaeolus papilionaceus]|nr:hypothetical protein BJ165DRAFT_1403203 [Panaeolus papilionaceus]
MDESKFEIAAVAVNVQPHSSLVLTIPEPPEIPARSPLRPQARSISFQSTTTKETQSIIQISPTPSTSTTANNMLDNVDQHRATSPVRSGNKSPSSSTPSSSSSSLPTQQPTAPSLPPSPRIPSSPSSSPTLPHQQYNSSSPPSSPSPPPLAGPQQPTSGYTKRQHALHELLSSERAYASDLALLQEYHIPLALVLLNLRRGDRDHPNSWEELLFSTHTVPAALQ